jgi:hypothetical protein
MDYKELNKENKPVDPHWYGLATETICLSAEISGFEETGRPVL